MTHDEPIRRPLFELCARIATWAAVGEALWCTVYGLVFVIVWAFWQ